MVFVTGDCHGNFRRFQSECFPEQANMTKDDTVIITGDFGGVWFGDSRDDETLDWLERLPFTLVFVCGNHENYDALARYPVAEWRGGKVHRVRPHVLHLTRNSSLWLRSTVSGESGIRTHAPLRTNGFQDRLVMTTSISLQSALSNVLINNTPQYHFCQAFSQVFFVFLFFSNCIQNMLFPCIAIINIWYSHVIYPINSFLLLKRIFSEFF